MATELGKAYVQIMPSAKGIKGSIEKELKGESESAGKSSGDTIASKIKSVIAAAGIGKALISSLNEGGKLEQSLGGIETLFKDNADTVKKYANEAYKTAGVSANDYMENVTSFSASLLQSLGGDTKKAAEISNMAMIDMADNSNKMGTAMQDIQNAYQGFAKQNYTMLDNLKLGYGGTKSEMERLLADATKLTGVKYDINNLSDVYEAIHAVQDELGITGTTALESAETFSGSMASMKAAFKNTLGSLALGENITQSLQGLAETVSTFLFDNLIPMVGTILQSLPVAISAFLGAATPQFGEAGLKVIRDLIDGIVSGIPELSSNISAFTSQIPGWIETNLPKILETGKNLILSLVNGIVSSAPSVIKNIGEILSNLIDAIIKAVPIVLDKGFELVKGMADGMLNNLPAVATSITTIIQNLIEKLTQALPGILQKGVELIGKLAMGILNNLPAIISAIAGIVSGILSSLIEALPKLFSSGKDLIGKLGTGLSNAKPQVIAAIKSIGSAIISGIGEFVGQMATAGWNLLMGLANGIGNAIGSVVAKAKQAAANVVGAVKGFFGIHSPSTVFAEIGLNLMKGLGGGVDKNIGIVEKAMENMESVATRSFESDVAMNINGASSLGNFNLATPSTQKQPVTLLFKFGENTFKAFVEDITNIQNSVIDLELAY